MLRSRSFAELHCAQADHLDSIGSVRLLALSSAGVADPQDLQIVNLESADSVVVVTLKAQHVGTYNFTIGSGIRAFVRVEAVPQRN